MQKILTELTDAIGFPATIEVVRRWGGRYLYVPVLARPGDALALTLGFDVARRLSEAYGGQRIQLPAERNALLDLRNAAIAADRSSGMSQEQIGLRYGLTRQSVSYILRRHEAQRTFAPTGAQHPARESGR